MMPAKTLQPGERFGKLTVIDRDGSRLAHAYWKCQCDCGKISSHQGSRLRAGLVLSCGCGRIWQPSHRRHYDKGESGKKLLLRSYKNGAKQRGFSFLLSEDEFFSVVTADCAYCGVPASSIKRQEKNTDDWGDFKYTGIDRIDSSKGYEPGNVRPCCGTCNKMKLDLPESVFLDKIARIHKHYQKAA